MRSIIIIFLILFGCSNQMVVAQNDKEEVLFEEVYLGIEGLKLVRPLKKFIRFENVLDENDSVLCQNWELTAKQLSGILSKMKEVNSTELYSLCYQIPCWYKSQVTSNGANFEILISSTSYIILHNKYEERFFILMEESDLFLEPCNCCE